MPREIISLSIDGSCLKNSSTEVRAEARIWFGHDDLRNQAVKDYHLISPNLTIQH